MGVHPSSSGSYDEQGTEVPYVTTDEVRKAMYDIPCIKVAGDDGITTDLIKHGGECIRKKLATLYTQCLKTATVPVS